MNWVQAFILLLVGLLLSCAKSPVKPVVLFQLSERGYLYDKEEWAFAGRLALSDKNNAISLSIKWNHQVVKGELNDKIEVVGLFGQGRTVIYVKGDEVAVDYGNDRSKFVGGVDDLLVSQLGISVPVSALRYWVLGLVNPKLDFLDIERGFIQSGWRVKYQQMKFVAEDNMPRKIKIERGNVKLKLIVDRWNIQ